MTDALDCISADSTDIQDDNVGYLSVADYDYELPDNLIARYPLEQRSASKLLYVPASIDATNPGSPEDHIFTALPDLLNAGDLIVFNDTKVMKARLFGQKDTGGRVEILIERLVDDYNDYNDTVSAPAHHNVALCHVKASKAPKLGQRVLLADEQMGCVMIGRPENLFILAFDAPILPNLERYG